MKVTQMVSANAEVVRITNITAGDRYKRMHKPSYGEPSLVFGYITDVLNDGENAVVVGVEFTPGTWGASTEPTVRTFSNDTDVAIFPATEDEWTTGLAEAIQRHTATVEAVRRDLNTKEAVLAALHRAAEYPTRTPQVAVIPTLEVEG